RKKRLRRESGGSKRLRAMRRVPGRKWKPRANRKRLKYWHEKSPISLPYQIFPRKQRPMRCFNESTRVRRILRNLKPRFTIGRSDCGGNPADRSGCGRCGACLGGNGSRAPTGKG